VYSVPVSSRSVNQRGVPPSRSPVTNSVGALARTSISIRLPPETWARWKATGPGWQTRMAEALSRAGSEATLVWVRFPSPAPLRRPSVLDRRPIDSDSESRKVFWLEKTTPWGTPVPYPFLPVAIPKTRHSECEERTSTETSGDVDLCAVASRGIGSPTLRQNAAKRGSSL
jgi:hypothetical protein